jgi:nucleotide-binding universal stress UspA family protein
VDLTDALAPWRTKYPDVAVTAQAAAVHPARRLGSIGQAALHHAHCPVAVAR